MSEEPLLRSRNSTPNPDKLIMERIESRYSSNSVEASNNHTPATSNEESLEEIILEKLDAFLNKLESRLDNFENYFKSDRKHSADKTLETKNNEFQKIYKTLSDTKNTLFDSSKKNLESLITTLDENYGYLTSNEYLSYHDKALIFLQFFDYKFNQLDNLINNKDIINLNELSIADLKLNFYNYDTALEIGESKYLHYYQLPLLWRENRYIIKGYRFNKNHTRTIKSICSCHNETANIWTHVLGFLLLVYIALYHYPSTIAYKNQGYSNFVIYAYLISAMQCLLFSVSWHTYSCFADFVVRSRHACIDYTGITILITASVITTEYASLYYVPKIRYFFMIFSAICGTLGLFFNWSPYFDKPESRGLRIGFFLSLAFLGCSAFFVSAYYNGLYHSLWFYSPLGKSFVWYLSGIVFYGNLIPERWRYDVVLSEDDCNDVNQAHQSGNSDGTIIQRHFKDDPMDSEHKNKFWSLWWIDYVLNSHNIWHIFVLFGILGHYSAILEMYRNISTNADFTLA